jgi:hypothetical protein
MHLRHPQAAEEVLKVVADRNQRYNVWGWKDPSADLYLEAIIAQLRNPHFVMVFRNPFDSAQSHIETGTPSIEIALESIMSRYARYWALLQKFCCPTLMVSYESSLSNPKELVSELCDFLAIKPKKSQISDAASFIDPLGGYRSPRPCGR